MTFREQAATDLPTFLNVDEFGQSVKIDGEAVVCVLEGTGDTPGSFDGVIDRDVLLHAQIASFHRLPVIDQQIEIGEGATARQYRVVGVDEDQGMAHLRLKWLDS